MTSETQDERLSRIRWCKCGKPWIPAMGLYGTTEQTKCSTCVLNKTLEKTKAEVHRLQRVVCQMEEAADENARQLSVARATAKREADRYDRCLKDLMQKKRQLNQACTMISTVSAHIAATGYCDDACEEYNDTDRAGTCTDPDCAYCAMVRALTTFEKRYTRFPPEQCIECANWADFHGLLSTPPKHDCPDRDYSQEDQKR